MLKDLLKEFKEFSTRGTALEMAVGVTVAAAFAKIVSSFVDNVLMPPIGFFLGKVDFSRLVMTLHEKTEHSPAVVISYGMFISSILDFIIVSLAVFILIKQVNRLSTSKKFGKSCPYCCSNISAKATRCPSCTSKL